MYQSTYHAVETDISMEDALIAAKTQGGIKELIYEDANLVELEELMGRPLNIQYRRGSATKRSGIRFTVTGDNFYRTRVSIHLDLSYNYYITFSRYNKYYGGHDEVGYQFGVQAEDVVTTIVNKVLK